MVQEKIDIDSPHMPTALCQVIFPTCIRKISQVSFDIINSAATDTRARANRIINYDSVHRGTEETWNEIFYSAYAKLRIRCALFFYLNKHTFRKYV